MCGREYGDSQGSLRSAEHSRHVCKEGMVQKSAGILCRLGDREDRRGPYCEEGSTVWGEVRVYNES
jgi:hypothetical protein